MSQRIQSVRGTKTLYGPEALKFEHIIQKFRTLSQAYGFSPMETPIFEFSKVFKRGLGDTSDIVSKEMYTFLDRNNEELTLRPEGTAGIARAYVDDGLSQISPFKVYYSGPMFRYERPQKGRQRQFQQLGIENIGGQEVFADLECIGLADQLLKELKISDQCQLLINSIGDEESRKAFREKLVHYLEKHEAELSKDSQTRLKLNPLRILDSKDEGDKKILQDAPKLESSLNEVSKKFKDDVLNGLARLNIPFKVDDQLVRGLDYYNHVVFEFVSSSLGAQSAVIAGGRYDGLIEQMGGNPTAGFGFGAGLERLSLLVADTVNESYDIMIVPIHNDLELEAFQMSQRLRGAGFKVFTHFSGNLSKRLKKAGQHNVKLALVLGPDEIQSKSYTIKVLDQKEQITLKDAELEKGLKAQLYP